MLGPAIGSEPMLVGLAVLSLLAEHADETGLLCLVDDARWLDRASRDALLFAARRLHAEGVVVVFAVRDGEGSFPAPGLPELRLSGLAPEAAAALLDRHPLAPAVRYRLLAEAGGNPLAPHRLLLDGAEFVRGSPAPYGDRSARLRIQLRRHRLTNSRRSALSRSPWPARPAATGVLHLHTDSRRLVAHSTNVAVAGPGAAGTGPNPRATRQAAPPASPSR